MNFSTHLEGTVGTVRLHGRFTFEQHQAFKTATTHLLEAPGLTQITLDLSGVSYMDSSSLGMILLLRERAENQAARVVLSRPSPSVQAVLKVVHFGKIFQIEE